MSRFVRLTVVVPDFTDSSESIRARQDVLYARLAGRGSVERKWDSRDAASGRLLPWQRGLLAALRLDEHAHPSAPLSALGAGLSLERTWLHAELVHFAAGLNEVALVRLHGEHAVTVDERAALLQTLREHVESIGSSIDMTAAGNYLLGSSQHWDVQTVTPELARTQDWNIALPRGPDAGRLRRLMTELQMLLHDHPVNEARARRGVPAANAVWLWGNGAARSSARADSPVCLGSNEYLAGVCSLESWSAPRSLTDLEQVLNEPNANSNIVVVSSEATSQEAQAQVLSTAVAALDSGRCRTIDLVLDPWHVSVDRWALKKFWRAPRSIEQWARA